MLDLDRRLADFMASHEIPGVSIAVWHQGTLHQAAAGVLNVKTGVEVTTDAIFQVGSITKLFTAALVMQLVDDGLVDLDAPVRTYLPSFALADEASAAAVTVRHLLTHTGGFHGDVFTDTGRGDDCLERYVTGLATAPQLYPVGAMWSYCNSGFSVLGAIVVALRGATHWEQVTRDRLIEPLGLTAALFPEEALLHRTSVGHHKPTGAERHEVHKTWQLPRSTAPVGASLTMSPTALVSFGRMLTGGGVGENGVRVLSAESVAAMTNPEIDTGSVYGTRMGLAVFAYPWNGTVAYGHDGNTIGQDALLQCFPEHDLVIAVCGNGGDSWLLDQDLLVPIVTDLTGATEPTRITPPDPPSLVDFARYTGRYVGPIDEWVVVATDDGLDITTVPGEMVRALGREEETHRWVHLRDERFIRLEPYAGGVYSSIAFYDDADILHAGRVYRRAR